MSIAEWMASVQAGSGGSLPSNPPAAGYFLIALMAVVLGFMVLVLFRSSARRSPRSKAAGRSPQPMGAPSPQPPQAGLGLWGRSERLF